MKHKSQNVTGPVAVLAFVLLYLFQALGFFAQFLLLPLRAYASMAAQASCASGSAAMLPGTLNVALSNYMQQYRNNKLIADILAPRVPVDREVFQYLIFDRAEQVLANSTLRAPGDKPETVRWSYSADTYNCKSHALDSSLPKEIQAFISGFGGFDASMKEVGVLTSKLMLDREASLASLLVNNLPSAQIVNLSGTSMFDNAASTPIELIDDYKDVILQAGVEANYLFLAPSVAKALRSNPEIVDRFKYTNAQGRVSLQQLAGLFDVENVIRAGAIQLDAGFNASWTWGVLAILAYIQPVSSEMDISPVKTFVWTGGPDTVDGYGVLQWPDSHLSRKTNWSSCDMYYDQKITGAPTIIVFANCTAAPTYAAIEAPEVGY
jgi:hypothetical protein